MDTGKFFIVDRFCAYTEEDTYENGCIPDTNQFGWDSHDMSFRSGFYPTIEDALKAVCEACYFDYDPNDWEYDEGGRFCGQFMVDVNNSQADDADLEKWREGKKRLWCCDLDVFVKVQTRPEDALEEDCANWNKSR